MSYSEKVLEAIYGIAARDGVNLFEASAQYCEEHDIEPSELADGLDAAAIMQIKCAAIEGRHVRRCVQGPINTLL